MQSMVSALQCDGVQSVNTNADLPDLIALLGGEHPHTHTLVHLATAHAPTPEAAIAALDKTWAQLTKHTTSATLLIRAYAPGHARADRDALARWKAIKPAQLDWMHWDVYDTGLEPGQAAYTLVAV